MSKRIIAGNWKMNKTQSETKQFISQLIPKVKESKNDVIICVPFTNLSMAIEMTKGTNVKVGAQNMHYEEKGAYTGEISAQMLYEMGVEYVIIGHSERRQYFAETDDTVNLKLKVALANDLIPILCVGETEDERERGIYEKVLEQQIKLDLKGISAEDATRIIIAYEPIWAIGTGKTASKEDADEALKFIINVIQNIYDIEVSSTMSVIYGGSVKASNAEELFNMDYIDGGLIGGASLNVEEFAKICNRDYPFDYIAYINRHVIC